MEVSIHGVGAPPADEAEAVGVDTATHECHGAARAGGSGGYEGWTEAGRGECADSGAKEEGHGCWRNVVAPGPRGSVEIGVKRRGWSGPVVAEMGEPAEQALNRAEEGVAAAGVADGFVPDTIFWPGKGERGECYIVQR